ncbi:hypothetical protein BGZ74_008283 [Mortierella antarctica]|nr:hypothetical protein BGZ74_008283 [Mortierella antarctica]
MSHDKGIITVVGQNEEQDDEDLVALRQLPRVNAHSKRCAQDIQDYQRLLAIKMRTLDDFTSGAYHDEF